MMRERKITGELGIRRKSDFISGDDDLHGYTESKPLIVEIVRAAIGDDVVTESGKKENDVRMVMVKPVQDGRAMERVWMRMNRAKEKILIAATKSKMVGDWSGVKLALYPTADLFQGDAKVAVGFNVRGENNTLFSYIDYQQGKARKTARHFLNTGELKKI